MLWRPDFGCYSGNLVSLLSLLSPPSSSQIAIKKAVGRYLLSLGRKDLPTAFILGIIP